KETDGSPVRAVAIAAGYLFSLVLKVDGSVWGFGDNSSGQLGYSSTDLCGGQPCSLTPKQTGVGALPSVLAVASGSANAHALAVGTDGHLWAWGTNANGQLGDGTQSGRSTP